MSFATSNFYRAMHFSAKRGLAIACRQSVRPSVCDVGGQGEHPEILVQSDPPPVDLGVGDIRSQIAAEWLQIAQRSQWRLESLLETTIALSNGAIADPLRPTPKRGFHMPQRYANGHISATGDAISK